MISIISKAIRIDEKVILTAPGEIGITHIFNDKIIILYESEDLVSVPPPKFLREVPVTSPESLKEVNRNILMLDFQGNVLWQIESHATYYTPWTDINPNVDKPGKWYAYNYSGYMYDIDIDTGTLSNGLFMR